MLDSALSIPWLRKIGRAVGACFSLFYVSTGLAAVDVCQPPADYSHLSVAYSNHSESSFDGDVGQANQRNYNVDLLFRSRETWAFGGGHHYDVLGIEQLEPQSNDHMHTVFFSLHRISSEQDRSFRFSVAPALAASSNVVKEPGEYSTDAFQLLGALMWTRSLSKRTALRYGVCGDHRFGRYELYPSINIDWRPHADWTIELGYPTTRVTYSASKTVDSSLLITPDGNEWHVRDRSLEKQSQLVYDAWLVEWAFRWKASAHIAISASIGRQFDNRYEFTLLDDRRVRVASDSVTRFGAALAWRF